MQENASGYLNQYTDYDNSLTAEDYRCYSQ